MRPSGLIVLGGKVRKEVLLTDDFDAAAHAVVRNVTAAFPGRVRAIYAEGSAADGTSVARSDLDLTIVFRDQFADDAEQNRVNALVEGLSAGREVELDLEVVAEDALGEGVTPQLKLGSRLFWGEDTREAMRLLPIDEWTRRRMHAAYWLAINVFHRPTHAAITFTWPRPPGAGVTAISTF